MVTCLPRSLIYCEEHLFIHGDPEPGGGIAITRGGVGARTRRGTLVSWHSVGTSSEVRMVHTWRHCRSRWEQMLETCGGQQVWRGKVLDGELDRGARTPVQRFPGCHPLPLDFILMNASEGLKMVSGVVSPQFLLWSSEPGHNYTYICRHRQMYGMRCLWAPHTMRVEWLGL